MLQDCLSSASSENVNPRMTQRASAWLAWPECYWLYNYNLLWNSPPFSYFRDICDVTIERKGSKSSIFTGASRPFCKIFILCGRGILLFKPLQGYFKVTGQTAGQRPAQLVESRGTTVTTKSSVLHLLKLSAAEGAEKIALQTEQPQTWRSFPGWRQPFLIWGRFVTTESITRKQIGLISLFHICFLLSNIPDSLTLELDCCEKATYKWVN